MQGVCANHPQHIAVHMAEISKHTYTTHALFWMYLFKRMSHMSKVVGSKTELGNVYGLKSMKSSGMDHNFNLTSVLYHHIITLLIITIDDLSIIGKVFLCPY